MKILMVTRLGENLLRVTSGFVVLAGQRGGRSKDVCTYRGGDAASPCLQVNHREDERMRPKRVSHKKGGLTRSIEWNVITGSARVLQ